jgi:hypothetical protein
VSEPYAAEPSLAQQIAEVGREIGMRKHVYPRGDITLAVPMTVAYHE